PRSFYAIFTHEQGRVTSDGIAEQTLVWRHLISGGLSYDEFHTVANHRFSGHLGPRTQGDGYIGAETKAKVVRLTLVNGVEHSLGRTLKLNQHFGCADRHSLSGSNVEWNTCPSPCVGVEPDRGERLHLRIRGDAFLVAVTTELAADNIGRSEWPHGSKSPLLRVSHGI